MTPNMSVEVSVVIPCLNEVQSIAACVDKAVAGIEASGTPGEVIVADNGSTDGSQQIATQHGARVVPAALRGYTHALREGIREARGKLIIMGDADDSYDFLEVPKFVTKWQEGYEVIMGNRYAGGIKPGAMPWSHRYIGNPVLSTMLRVVFGTPFGDSHCGLRAFTKDAWNRLDLKCGAMEFASEFGIRVTRVPGLKMAEVPVVLWPDKRGRPPHLHTFRDGWLNLRFMLLFAPNWLFLGPGAALMAVGLLLVIWLLPGPHCIGGVCFDIHTMFFGVLFTLLGTQILMIGLFAKIFSYTERFDHSNLGLGLWLRRLPLESGLLAGMALAIVGFVGDVAIFWKWKEGRFGAFSEMRWLLFWSMLFFIGLQIVFSSFFMSMLGISRGTYRGDYDVR